MRCGGGRSYATCSAHVDAQVAVRAGDYGKVVVIGESRTDRQIGLVALLEFYLHTLWWVRQGKVGIVVDSVLIT